MQRTYVRRRRRLAATMLLVAVLAVGSPVARAVGGPGGSSDQRNAAAVHVVAVGDTLWSIAEGHDPARDPRAVVHEIAELNGLGEGPLIPGRTLRLPAIG